MGERVCEDGPYYSISQNSLSEASREPCSRTKAACVASSVCVSACVYCVLSLQNETKSEEQCKIGDRKSVV